MADLAAATDRDRSQTAVDPAAFIVARADVDALYDELPDLAPLGRRSDRAD